MTDSPNRRKAIHASPSTLPFVSPSSVLRTVPFIVLVSALSTASLPAQSGPPEAPDPAADEAPVADVLEDSITITAHRVETPRHEVGSSVSLITAADIERHQWPTVADALRSVPGLEVVRSGGAGQVTSVFVRGGSSSQVLVLLDGVRLGSATTGAFDFADLTTDAVERIEVVRGPQSTLYGSEAAAGVISIISRRAASADVASRVSGRFEGGEDDHHRMDLSIAGRSGAFDYLLSLADHHSDGTSAADRRGGNPEPDAWSNTSASAHLGWQLGTAGEHGRLDVDLRHTDSEVDVDGFGFGVGPVDDLDARHRRQALTGGVSLRLTPTARWTQTLRVGVANDELRGEDPTDAFSRFVIDSRSVQASAQADIRFGAAASEASGTAGQTLTFGAEWESREGGTVGTFGDEVEIVSVFVQEHLDLGRSHLTLGARHDDHSRFGGETTWRVAAAIDVGGAGRVHGSWGTGFKAPTLNDLFFPGFGNPDLVPETSQGVDLGYEHRFGERWRFDATVFEIDFDDLIAFDFVTFLPQNIAAARSQGAEVQLAYTGERFDLAAHHTWNETEDEGTGRQLARRPEHRSVVDLTWRPASSWRLATLLFAVADRIDSDGSRLEDYERVDLTVEYRAWERWRPYLRVVNVLDQEYSEVGGFGTQGTTSLVGLRLTR